MKSVPPSYMILDSHTPSFLSLSWWKQEIIIENNSHTHTLSLDNNTQVKLYGFLKNKYHLKLTIHQKEKSSLESFFFLYSNDISHIHIDVFAQQKECISSIHVVNCMSGWEVTLHTAITVNKEGRDSQVEIIQKNIFLKESKKLIAFPKLNIATNHVKASHACSVESIASSSLYYFESRGIPKQKALFLIIQGYFDALFSPFKAKETPHYHQWKQELQSMILHI